MPLRLQSSTVLISYISKSYSEDMPYTRFVSVSLADRLRRVSPCAIDFRRRDAVLASIHRRSHQLCFAQPAMLCLQRLRALGCCRLVHWRDDNVVIDRVPGLCQKQRVSCMSRLAFVRGPRLRVRRGCVANPRVHAPSMPLICFP